MEVTQHSVVTCLSNLKCNFQFSFLEKDSEKYENL